MHRSKTRFLAFVAAIAVVAGLFATALAQSGGDVLRIRWYEDMDNLDPVRLQDSLGNELATHIYDRLVRPAPGSFDTLAPDLAERWEVSDDGLVYTFYLRPGARWQRGYGPVTAEDVRYSLMRHKDPAVGSVYATAAEPIQDVVVVDDHTVQVIMSQPYPGFLLEFAAYRPGFIVHQAAIEAFGDRYMDQPVGSGAYQLSQWSPLDRVVLTAHPEYDGTPPQFGTLEYLIIPDDNVFEIALQNGEVDIGYIFDPQVQQRAMASTRYATLSMSAPRVIYISANLETPGLDDVRVRQALWYAIDRDLLVDAINLGQATVTDTVLNPTVFGYLADRAYDYDVDKAKELMAAAGHADGLSLRLLIQGNYQIPAMAQAIQDMWREIGVEVEITLREFAQIVEIRRAGDFDLVMGALARTGPDQYMTPFFDSAAIPYPNSSRYANPAMDELIYAARVTVDDDARRDLYFEAQRIAQVDAPVIPILNPVFVLAHRSDLQNVTLNLLTIDAESFTVGR